MIWALWNNRLGRYYTVEYKIELYDEDEAFATACAWSTVGPVGSPVWTAVPFVSLERAEFAASMYGLAGVYDASGSNRRKRSWSDAA